MKKEKIRIGCGAGFSGDRIDPAIVLVERGQLDYLVLECLAERTIALAQKRKLANPNLGYDIMLERRITSLFETLLDNKVTLITNMGAANPVAAADLIVAIAEQKHLKVKVAAITGDDVFSALDRSSIIMETGEPLTAKSKLVSANAYLGIESIVDALNTGAQIIVTGRVADPSLFLAPMVRDFGWSTENYDLLGKGTVIGHLLECAGQITGGYFADPGKKDVTDMHNLGHPYADVFHDGSALISKVKDTGGTVSLATAKEQLLYEVLNPHEYYTPDVIADFTSVKFQLEQKDHVRVSGGSGKEKPATLKVSVGYQAHFLGEGEITYAGTHALQRARLAEEIVRHRLKNHGIDIRTEFIGINSAHNFPCPADPYEVRLRVAGKVGTLALAEQIGNEVEALYTNGPGGGGGVRKHAGEVIGIISTLIDRKKISTQIHLRES